MKDSATTGDPSLDGVQEFLPRGARRPAHGPGRESWAPGGSMLRQVSDGFVWARQLPERAPVSICLPAYAGRVVVRTYDADQCWYDDVPGSGRWVMEWTVLSRHETHSSELCGPVYPGDCVVYRSPTTDPQAAVWFPQRVIDVATSRTSDEQAVLTLRDRHATPQAISATGFASALNRPLTGTIRRWALEPFDLNVDCERCGNRGAPLRYEVAHSRYITPANDDHAGAEEFPVYSCRVCRAEWRIGEQGELEFLDNYEAPLPGL